MKGCPILDWDFYSKLILKHLIFLCTNNNIIIKISLKLSSISFCILLNSSIHWGKKIKHAGPLVILDKILLTKDGQ